MPREEHEPTLQPKRVLVTSRRRFLVASSAASALALGGGRFARSASAAPGSIRTRTHLAQDSGSEIIIATLGDAATINPFDNPDSEGQWRCKMLFDEVIRANPQTYAAEPGLASEWAVDGLKITFTINQAAKFSDGTDVTADDVKFSIMGHLNPANASEHQAKFLAVDGAEAYIDGSATDVTGLQVTDPKTLVMTLAKPEAAIIFNMRYVWVVPKAQLEGKDLKSDPFFQKPVGAGPYVFESWASGGDFVATANPNYWQESRPSITKFTHRTIADANSIVLALVDGAVDASNYPAPTAKEQLEQNPELTIVAPPFSSPNGWYFNCTHEHLSKKEVRRAIAMALNSEQFAADSLLGLGKAGLGPIAPDSWAFDPTLEPIPYDPATAKSMIDAAGASGAEIRFTVNTGNVLREDWLTYTQQALEEIGIVVKPEPMEYATLLDLVQKNRDFDVSGVDHAGVTAEPSALYEQFHSKSPGNYAGYSNPELDTLLVQAKETLDQEAAKPIYAQIQRIIMEDVPMHFAWYRPFLHAYKSSFTNVTDSAAFGLVSTLELWDGPSA